MNPYKHNTYTHIHTHIHTYWHIKINNWICCYKYEHEDPNRQHYILSSTSSFITVELALDTDIICYGVGY